MRKLILGDGEQARLRSGGVGVGCGFGFFGRATGGEQHREQPSERYDENRPAKWNHRRLKRERRGEAPAGTGGISKLVRKVQPILDGRTGSVGFR